MVPISHIRRHLGGIAPDKVFRRGAFPLGSIPITLVTGPPASGSAAWIIRSRDIQTIARLKGKTVCLKSSPKKIIADGSDRHLLDE
jgi:hypothetical protein